MPKKVTKNKKKSISTKIILGFLNYLVLLGTLLLFPVDLITWSFNGLSKIILTIFTRFKVLLRNVFTFVMSISLIRYTEQVKSSFHTLQSTIRVLSFSAIKTGTQGTKTAGYSLMRLFTRIGRNIVSFLEVVDFIINRILHIVRTSKGKLMDLIRGHLNTVNSRIQRLIKRKQVKRVKKKSTKSKTSSQDKKVKRVKVRSTSVSTQVVKVVAISKKRMLGYFMLGVVSALLFIACPIYLYSWYKTLPQPELLQEKGINSTTKILDRYGRVLYEIYVDKKYDPVPLEAIPNHVVNATLAIEDSDFYSHIGFSPTAIVRAAKAILLEDDLQGGSTITQQLVKNLLLTPERTYERKIKELVLAVMVERSYSKDEILGLYLNNIPYGGTAYGIQAASQKYFAKDVQDLTLAEAAILAGLPSAPSAYSPVQGGVTFAKQRQLQVLGRMVALNYITAEEADAAYSQDLVFAPQVEYIRAPHFVEYVRQALYQKYGQKAVDFGGLTVTTTLDLDVQDEVQRIVYDEVSTVGRRLNFTNGAAVVLDNTTGEILAYVGSADYFGEDFGKFDILTAYRQPGSSIKPVTYALALENGLTAASRINDTRITYQLGGGQTYTPKNYDNKFHGSVTLRRALSNSYNIPAVKLAAQFGPDSVVQLGRNMGLSNWIPGDGSYGLAVTLGGKETRLLELANLYATFARQGRFIETTPIVSIRDVYGFEIYRSKPQKGTPVMRAETAYIISHILSDNVARTSAFGSRSQLHIPGKAIAVKTGTTNDIRDNLTLGYTPKYTVGVWVGNNDNSVMNPYLSSGLTGAAPIWNRIFTFLLVDQPNESFDVPENIVTKSDASCGITEVFDKASSIPSVLCAIKKENKADTDGEDE